MLAQFTAKMSRSVARTHCIGQRSFSSSVIVRTYGHTYIGPTALPGPLQWSVKIPETSLQHSLKEQKQCI